MKFHYTAMFIFLVMIGDSCKKTDPIIPNEEELITTITYSLTPFSGGQTIVFAFKDLDGDGGNAPLILGGTLKANTNYSGKIVILNETQSPAGDIGTEVMEEGVDHQFFFTALGGLDASVEYDDEDQNGNPLGLNTILRTAEISTGELTITLRHKPDKMAIGVASGDLANAGGETDIEVTFNVKIQ